MTYKTTSGFITESNITFKIMRVKTSNIYKKIIQSNFSISIFIIKMN